MTRLDEVEVVLQKIKDQLTELVDVDGLEELTAEELVVLSVEMATGLPVTQIEMGQPVAWVDRDRACFVIDDDLIYPLSGENYYGQEGED